MKLGASAPAVEDRRDTTDVGRARRSRARRIGGGDVELWELDARDRTLAERLLRAGEARLGGFSEAGTEGARVWLIRPDVGRSDAALARVLRGERGPWPPSRAIRVGLDIASALAMAETERVWLGPLTTDGVFVDGDRAIVVADAWIEGLVGAPPRAVRAEELSPQYTPPEQADGAPWDDAANRYVLGLVLYRMIGGAHPFRGAGLRHALDEAKHRGAPPFDPLVAKALPPGLQSAVLSMLDPDPRERPTSARAIQESFARFADPHRVDPTLVSGKRPADRGASASRTSPERGASEPPKAEPPRHAPNRAASRATRSRSFPVLSVALPIALSVAVGAAALTLLRGAPPSPSSSAKAVAVRAAKPLAPTELAARDCDGCHPRQTAEWRRSVMGHSVKSPLFNALEMLVEEQVGRDVDCPNGAGILRKADERTACRDRATQQKLTGAGGEHWCVNCHSPGENLDAKMPAWEGLASGDPHSRLPPRDLLGARAMEGVSCGFCHTAHGPASPGGAYQGNPTWVSPFTGATFSSRPEDLVGVFGIGNSGYDLRPTDFVFGRADDPFTAGSIVAHRATPAKTESYLASSEFCRSCHDVRLFGTDAIGGRKGEHFKRLRNVLGVGRLDGRGEAEKQADRDLSELPHVRVPRGVRGGRRAPIPRAQRAAQDSSQSRRAPTRRFVRRGLERAHPRDDPLPLRRRPAALARVPPRRSWTRRRSTAFIPLSARKRRDLCGARSGSRSAAPLGRGAHHPDHDRERRRGAPRPAGASARNARSGCTSRSPTPIGAWSTRSGISRTPATIWPTRSSCA
ncbi:MAG: hypothetical protein U0414_27785 [Polyangiaceae bacterium]